MESSATLTGVVIRKEWSKSYESWNAGGSEYYVLKVDDAALPLVRRTAREGVILRPSKRIACERFAELVGKTVECQGKFVDGRPHLPPRNSMEQMPSPALNPFTGKTDYPVAGCGFEVSEVTVVANKEK
jgi:hypothetical protein